MDRNTPLSELFGRIRGHVPKGLPQDATKRRPKAAWAGLGGKKGTMEAEKKAAPIKVTRKRQYYDAAYKRNAVELAVREGYSVRAAAAVFNVSAAEYYRWRREYGGLKLDQAKRLKDLDRENDRLKRAVSELTLDKLILKEALEGKY